MLGRAQGFHFHLLTSNLCHLKRAQSPATKVVQSNSHLSHSNEHCMPWLSHPAKGHSPSALFEKKNPVCRGRVNLYVMMLCLFYQESLNRVWKRCLKISNISFWFYLAKEALARALWQHKLRGLCTTKEKRLIFNIYGKNLVCEMCGFAPPWEDWVFFYFIYLFILPLINYKRK